MKIVPLVEYFALILSKNYSIDNPQIKTKSIESRIQKIPVIGNKNKNSTSGTDMSVVYLGLDKCLLFRSNSMLCDNKENCQGWSHIGTCRSRL